METIKTVLSGFVGIRRKADHEKAPLNPLHVVIAAVILVALFIGTLITIVRIVVK
ncbi:MAG: DUF2970 domain-containing protein [Pseudomonadota bacterium]